MAAAPPAKALAAFTAASSRVTRRAEIYEQDGKTLWNIPGLTRNPRLIGGSVAVSSTSGDGRRTLECELENSDGYLKSYPGGFWYDKVIKVFRGVEFDKGSPKIVIIQDPANTANTYKTMLQTFGYTDVSIKTNVRTLKQLLEYDIILALGGFTSIDSVNVTPLLNQLYALGKAVFTTGNDNTSSSIPLIAATQSKPSGTGNYRIEPTGTGHYAGTGWLAEDQSPDAGTVPTAIRAGAVAVAQMTYNSVLSYTAIAEENTAKGRWFHYHEYVQGAQASLMIRRAFDWLDDTRDRTTSWEVQCGEFMIDEISSDHEPNTVKIKGRDYVKKCQMSKLGKATTFKKGQDLDVVIRALAANAGITKMNIPQTNDFLGRDFAYEADVDRWSIMVDLATAYSWDIYFDNTGTLVMTPFADPAGKTTTYTFKTGTGGGNLVSYSKTTNDTRIYNHIIVIGQAANSTPIFSEAKNTVANSPTSISELGDRVFRYTSSLIATQYQADKAAKTLLFQHALEEFSLDLSSIVIPWLEAGQVVDFIDPSPSPGDPTRFLLTDFSIPLGLEAMSATAKRVRQVLS